MAFEGMSGPDPFDPDPLEPDPADPEPPEPDPVDPEPVDPDPPDPDEPAPEPPESDPDELDVDDPDPDEPDPDPAGAVPALTTPAEQAERQKKERLKSAKRNCERWCFIDSSAESASAHADRSQREVGMRLIRSICAHTTPIGANASFYLPLWANTLMWLRRPSACVSPETRLNPAIHQAAGSQRRVVT